MSDPDPNDEQGLAEAFDEDVLGADEVADIGEDVVREEFPPDRQQGIDVPSPYQQVPDELPPRDEPVTGLLETHDVVDDEPDLVADLGDPERNPPAEEAAVHLVEEDPPLEP
jgi:hypothetical protein